MSQLAGLRPVKREITRKTFVDDCSLDLNIPEANRTAKLGLGL